MLRNLAAALALILLSQSAIGLGLGTLKQSSALNEPFDGRIEILGATAADFDTISVKLADTEQFDRAGVLREAVLFKLKFNVVESRSGSDYIEVSSHDPIREPFLNFLLELNWANGRMVREYTVLLDPPLYDSNRRRAAVAAPVAAPAPAPVTAAPEPVPAPMPAETMAETAPMVSTPTVEPAPMAEAAPAPEPMYGAGDTFGPVQTNDTLWSIASANLPDDSVSVQQMMLALLRANPEAFGSGNINILKRGAILRMPEYADINATSRAEAFEEVKRQHQLWSDYRGLASETVTEEPVAAEPDTAAMEPDEDETMAADEAIAEEAIAEEAMDEDVAAEPDMAVETETGDARLELVAPSADDDQMGAGAAAEGAADVTLAREELDAQVQENEELQSRITEANEIIDLMQRQVDIKDDELAALQARLAELGIEAPAEAMAGLEDATQESTEEVLGEEEVMAEQEAVAEVIEADSEMPADEGDVAEVDITIGDEAVVPDTEVEEVVELVDDTPATADDGGGALGGLIPGHIVNMVPGGAMTVLGVLGAILLGIVALLFKLISGRRDEDEDELGATAAAAGDEDMTSLTEDFEEEDEPITETREEEAAEAETFDSEDTTEVAPEFDETSPEFQRTLEATASELQAEETEEDPLEEVNVYLAYERFDQAEELVRKVIGDHPDEHKYKLRLLEVFYSSNNKAAYEEAARSLHDSVGDDDPLWESAVAMWTEMSPDRALFAEGEAEAQGPGAGEKDASAFVDITAEDEAGGSTMTMSPGSDTLLESTQVSLGGGLDEAEDTGSLDFDLGASEADGADDEILDLTATTDDADGSVLDLTATTDEVDDSILDLTATTDEADDDILDLTATTAEDELLDLTAGMDESGDDEVLDLTADFDEAPAAQSDALDVSAEGDFTDGDDLLDLTTPESDAAHDMLDVTKTGGDLAGEQTDDILNVTSPGLLGAEEPTPDEEPAAAKDSDSIDFDISDTVSPAYGAETEAEESLDEMFDITAPAEEEAADGALDFDIGELEDTTAEFNADDETLDISGGLDFDSGTAESGEGLDLEIPEEDPAGEQDSVETVEMEAVKPDEQIGIDTVPREGTEPTDTSADDAVDFDLSLQSSELDELSIGGDTIGGAEAEVEGDTESEIEFDLALQDTTEMDSLIIDETLELPKASAPDESLEDLAKSMEESMADLDLADDDIDETGDLDLSLADTSGGLDIDFSAPEGGDTETSLDFDLDDLDLDNIDPADTVAMDLSEDSGSSAIEDTVVMPTEDDGDQPSDADEVDTKLNLAKAYIELGDNDGARSILDEVARDGTNDQQAEAQRLIEQLG